MFQGEKPTPPAAQSSRSAPLNHALRLAVLAGVESAVRLHVARGDDLNARDARGMTPLMIAASRNKGEICRLLLEAGAVADLVDTDGRTAYDIAVQAGAKDAAALLLSLNRGSSTQPEATACSASPPRPDVPPEPPRPGVRAPHIVIPFPVESAPAAGGGPEAGLPAHRPEPSSGPLDADAHASALTSAPEPGASFEIEPPTAPQAAQEAPPSSIAGVDDGRARQAAPTPCSDAGEPLGETAEAGSAWEDDTPSSSAGPEASSERPTGFAEHRPSVASLTDPSTGGHTTPPERPEGSFLPQADTSEVVDPELLQVVRDVVPRDPVSSGATILPSGQVKVPIRGAFQSDMGGAQGCPSDSAGLECLAAPALSDASLAAADAPGPAPLLASTAAALKFDEQEFDLSDWEVESDTEQPSPDLNVLTAAIAVQKAITSHAPTDSSADWDDIDVQLPEEALPLTLTDDAETRARLRLLLLRALREGSVPGLAVEAMATDKDGMVSSSALDTLSRVVNDLGAELDERFEYAAAHESFEVFVDPAETLEEEAGLDEALLEIDRASSLQNDPLRLYQREFLPIPLLTAEEEVAFAQAMESALDAAVDALAAWPEGLLRTLAAGDEVLAGSRSLSSVCAGGEPEPDLAASSDPAADEGAAAPSNGNAEVDDQPADGTVSERSEMEAFAKALLQLRTLLDADAGRAPQAVEVRRCLATMRLTRQFLLELNDMMQGAGRSPGFKDAMSRFRQARDRMIEANLRLAFFHARKYAHTGELLEDLTQEGNMGLMKAVDRWDWRKGFRFSTYATWWVRQFIGRSVADKSRTIRVPVHMFEKLQRLQRFTRQMEAAKGRAPTLRELAAELEMPDRKVEALLRIAPEPLPIGNLEVDGMVAIEERDAVLPRDPAEEVDDKLLRIAVERWITSLNDLKVIRILRMRFGIGMRDAWTLEEVGQLLGVTRERIRQIETKTIGKLKHPARSEVFARKVFGLTPTVEVEPDE